MTGADTVVPGRGASIDTNIEKAVVHRLKAFIDKKHGISRYGTFYFGTFSKYRVLGTVKPRGVKKRTTRGDIAVHRTTHAARHGNGTDQSRPIHLGWCDAGFRPLQAGTSINIHGLVVGKQLSVPNETDVCGFGRLLLGTANPCFRRRGAAGEQYPVQGKFVVILVAIEHPTN